MKLPKKFTGLHAHDGFSTFDGMGLPKEHFEYVISNTKEEGNIPALAITNHGQMNSFCHAWLAVREMNKTTKTFKFLPGVEAYAHPDLNSWNRLKEAHESDDDAAEHGSTVENESESKSNKHLNPLNRKHHLVILAKSSKGLQNLFSLVSRGYLEGFYKKPRIEYSWLKKFKGELLLSTACIGGPLSYDIFSEFATYAFDKTDANGGLEYLGPHVLDNEFVRKKIIGKLENTIDTLIDVAGHENVFLELQFNKLSSQHLTNRALIELSKKTGLKLVVTCDSHYCKPDVWRERAIYQKLGWLNYADYDPTQIPQSVEDLKAELYPKNAAQLWETYKKTTEGYSFYDDALVCDAIERTHDIAFDMIGDVQPDTSVKLPSWSIPKGKTADEALSEMAWTALRKMGLDGTREHWDRLKTPDEYSKRLEYELKILAEKKFSAYFLTMKVIIDTAAEHMLIGPGRGSSAGSLVNYVLGITQVDPLQYDLIFERFINPLRSEAPDIDSDVGDRDFLIQLLKQKFGNTNVVPVSNYNTFQLKSLIKDVSRFFHRDDDDGLDFQSVNRILTPLDDEVRRKVLKQGDDKNLFELKLEHCLGENLPEGTQPGPAMIAFKEFMDSHPDVANPIKVLLHENKSLGKHASGVIVSEDIAERMPLILSKKEPQTPWVEGMHYKALNEIGWIKFDLLGLETIRIIQRCIELIVKRQAGKKLDLTFDGQTKITCYENDSIMLRDCSFKRIKDLTDDDDVHESLTIRQLYAQES